MWDVEFGKGKGAEGPRCIGRAKIVDDPCGLAEITAPWQQFSLDKVALISRQIVIALQRDGVATAAFRLLQDETATAGDDSSEQPALRGFQNPDDPPFIACAADPFQAGQYLLADPCRAAAAFVGCQPDRRRRSRCLGRRYGQKRAVTIDLADHQYRHFGKLVRGGNAASGLFGDASLFGKFAQAAPERCAGFLWQAEGARDLLYRFFADSASRSTARFRPISRRSSPSFRLVKLP